MNKNLTYILIIGISIFFTGCATSPPVSSPPAYLPPPVTQKPSIEGMYHRVKKGETLWRISRAYDVDLDTIVTANRLEDFTKIKVGQQIFIPGARKEKEVYSAKTNDYTFMNKPDFIWPVKGKVISFFGSKKNGVSNKGIDIQAKPGAAAVASRGGKVTFVDENLRGYGKTVIIDHQDGYSTVYSNNSEILVKIGQYISQNMAVAKVGSTGRAVSASLHFEIRKKHRAQNPFYYLP